MYGNEIILFKFPFESRSRCNEYGSTRLLLLNVNHFYCEEDLIGIIMIQLKIWLIPIESHTFL